MSDDEVSQASSPYTSEAEEEELELEDFADQEAEAEAEEAEAELEGEAEGEGEQAEESEEEEENDSEEESEEEEEEGEDDDAEGDEDDEEAADLEAALENMEAMDDEPQDDDEPMKPADEVPAVPEIKPETPAQKRRGLFVTNHPYPKSYGIEPICALPHPVATDSLASSLCMTYLLTGSQDGFIRCYDFFSSVNNKTFLTAPQRAHCGIAEGNMKAGVLKFWWENWAPTIGGAGTATGSQDKNQGEEKTLSAVHSMVLQADALWGLSGTEQWDLNTGQMVRMYGTPRNSGGNTQEVVSLGLRPLTPLGTATNPHSELFSGGDSAAGMLSSNKSGTTLGHDRDGDDDGDSGSSDGSLFGDDSGDDDEGGGGNQKKGASKANGVQAQNSGPNATRSSNQSNSGGPILSPDIVMTAYIDGQVLLWDRRNPSQSKPLRLEMGEKSPPWCVSGAGPDRGPGLEGNR
ncbi:Transcription factor spt8 [Tulasnella sp. 408]|nr:Transcription factor spt8 [Tulasnella sp. 408]